ncbi:MAG: glycosyltransferase [Proteobacteria bacterium]|nr:glycosyltransferase [Pseudomonadota bacterium]
MSEINLPLALYGVIISIVWSVIYLKTFSNLLRVPFFDKLSPPSPAIWPKLSVIIPACNEEDTIEAALNTLLDQDYPDMEVIVVNDRSTDRTSDIISRLAKEHWALRVIHVDNLPDGWLGKVHAMHVGTMRAKGEWLLYTDADVHFSQGAIRKGVALALEKVVDHLAIGPGVKANSFLLEVVINAFGAMFMFFTGAGGKKDEDNDKAVGIGAFNLVRRAAFDKTEGFSWLKMEVADDVGLGLLLKKSNASFRFAIAKKEISLIWYASITEMFRGLEKNIFGATSYYSYSRMIAIFLISIAFISAPFFTMIYLWGTWLWPVGLIAYLLLVATGIIMKIRFNSKLTPAFFLPLGQLIIGFMLLNAGLKCYLRGGILWRGSLYKISELRQGQRVKM